MSGETQRGSIPHTLYGDIQFQLSGFAINTLRQGIDSVISPRIEAMESAYTTMCMLLTDQYLTESFNTIELSGKDMNRQYFSQKITPTAIKDAGDMEITFVGQLPQDDMTKMSMAQIAREGESPLLPDIHIRDKILGLQDTDMIDDAINEQLAEKALPEAQLYTLMKSAEERGRPDLAQLYFGELTTIINQKLQMQIQSQQMLQQTAMTGQQQGAATPPTADPRVAPNAMMGAPPPAPTPQAGGFVPPGTPRPGAQSPETRADLLRQFGPEGV